MKKQLRPKNKPKKPTYQELLARVEALEKKVK